MKTRVKQDRYLQQKIELSFNFQFVRNTIGTGLAYVKRQVSQKERSRKGQ